MIAAEFANAPRVWIETWPGMKVRVIDPGWLEAQRAATASMAAGGSIISDVAALHKLTIADILGKGQSPAVRNARHHAIYEVARRNRGWTNAMVARAFGLKDRTTIIKAIRMWPIKAKRLGIPIEPIGPSLVGPRGLR